MPPPLPSSAKPPRLSRRRFLRRAALATGAVAVGTVGYTWRIEPHWVEVVRRPLPIANLPAGLVGRTLVQISDLHVGPVVDEAFMCDALRHVSALAADVVVVTGDFMSTNGSEQVPNVQRVIANLALGKLATVAILGNHDYGRGWRTVSAADDLTDMLRGRGFTVLRNGVTDVAGLQVAGVDDYWSPRFDPAATLAQLDPRRAALALCHNPDGVDAPAWSAYRGWVLSGHTHGGQCKPPFLPPPMLPVNNRRYTSGEFVLAGGRSLYINRGLGYLHRVRFNCRPEVTLFTLAPAVA